MSVSKSILNVKRQQATVKFVSDGGGTSNVALTEFAKADETTDFGNVAPEVNICHLYFTVDDVTKVTRNNVVILSLVNEDNWNLSQEMGIVLSEENDSDIEIDFGTANGTVIITVTKAAGYKDPEQQSLQPWQR